jgi:hypothetical protein
VVAVLLLTPVAHLMLVLALAWLVVVSLWMLRGSLAAG